MIRIFIFITALFFCTVSSAQEVLQLKKANGVTKISEHILLYEDVSGEATIEQVLHPEIQKKFFPSQSSIPNFNVTRSAIWSKIRFTTSENNIWCLEYGMPSVQEVSFYRVTPSGIKELKSGILTPLEMRTQVGHRVIFDLEINKHDTIDYYIRVKDIAPLRVLLRAGSLQAFFNDDHATNFWHGLYFGTMILMALYNLFLFITNRSRVYIYYVLYVTFCALFISFFTGYAAMFSEGILWFFVKVPVFAPVTFGVFGMLFTMEFLYTKKHIPVLHKVLAIFTVSVTLPLIISMTGNKHLSLILIQVYGLIFALLSIWSAIAVLRKGYRPAKFYLLGFGAYMVGLFMVITADFLNISNEFVSMYSLELGSLIEVVVLSFAIGDKLNSANRERVQAQQKAMEALQKNEQLVKEQNVLLEKKVAERTYELNEQKLVVEEKNKEITDSINYARRIQEAILPPIKLVEKYLPDSFILYKPKDIVAGDFYWMETAMHENNEVVLFAAADCTGHGVPGAMVSVVCASALNRAVKEFHLTVPGEILNKVRELVIETFEKSETEVSDGMDISLCCLNTAANELLWSGANNSLWIMRNNNIMIYNGDKQPIGKYIHPKPFTTHRIGLKKEDTLFIFTDGFADQFGGDKGKKFKAANMQKLFLSLKDKEMNYKRQEIDHAFESWKAGLEQVDDVCVIGIRI